MSYSAVLYLAIIVFIAMMYVRVELDFKRNLFRVAGHALATLLLLALAVSLLGFGLDGLLIDLFLLSVVFLFVNEVIRIYLRKHSMKDILENHPRLYWLARGKRPPPTSEN